MKTHLLFLIIILGFQAVPVLGHELDGVWEVPCRDGLKKQQQTNANGVLSIEIFYRDKNCTHPSFRFQTQGSNAFQADHPTWINFTYEELSLTVYIEEVIEDLNNRKVCGLTNWKQGEPQIITGMKCALFNINKETQIPNQGDQKFGIYKIEENRLYYGILTKELDGSEPKKRPQIFNSEAYTKK